MHYAEYKHHDPSLVGEVVETFPFAAILVNGDDGPLVAQAPLTFRPSQRPAGAVEFHLAKANPIAASLSNDVPISIFVQGPGAAISPTWFTASFQGDTPDRSLTAPTYNYLSLVLRGRLQLLGDEALQVQIGDLVRAHEPADGWQVDELAPSLWTAWRGAIQLYRLEIDAFDLTAKFSHGEIAGDRPGVVDGLRRRGHQEDEVMARLVEHYDGSAASLRTLVRSLGYA